MKLVRYGDRGSEKSGLVDDEGVVRGLSAEIPDIGPQQLSRKELDRLAALDASRLPKVRPAPRLGVPVFGIGKIVAVGLNYADHAREAGMPIPEEPVLFMKATSALSGPYDPVVIPRGAEKMDWEVELGVVIGTTARYVEVGEALAHVAGYTIVNDVSERRFQLERGGQWVKGKSADTFAPIGPWLATADEIPDPQQLALWCEVNGRRFQDGSTSSMIFGVARLVSYISHFMTLHPGDLISTGTPPGVGMAQKPPVFLKPGDRMRLGIDGLGEQRLEVVDYEE
jgi:2-keto-4-pentenoate hydratase/2-oxohepta-3-ene-1,7-dioic acid hydratase in catechol pathway